MAQEAIQQKQIESAPVRDLDPNVRQRKASEPGDSVWVSASAGTGKTKVLTDRVLRLLLPREDGAPGTQPHRILCLTFTKAGASEMALRINQELTKWAVLPLESLQEELQNLRGRKANEKDIQAARKLFAQVVDTPGGLKIMTIHSFCQSVLGRFPLEAGLSPHFTVLEEGQASLLLSQARDRVLQQADSASPIKEATGRVASQVNEDQFFGLIREFAKERYQLAQNQWGPEALYTQICTALGVQAGKTARELILAACHSDSFDEAGLRNACSALSHGTDTTDRPKAQGLQQWLDAGKEQRVQEFERYLQVYFTIAGDLRKTMATRTILMIMPDCADILMAEAERLRGIREQVKVMDCALLTRDLFTLGQNIINEYQLFKEKSGVLDFDDLIARTLDLLAGRTGRLKPENAAPWVMYKLDQGLDHILIDEAQDTNPEQWQIIAALCEEFFSGQGARDDIERTVFTVGDEKQSIYSFQRAAPEEFFRMREYMAEKMKAAGKQLEDVGLNISFRSTGSVLKFVDTVFSNPEIAKGLGLEPIQHHSYRKGQAGLAEIWPLFETEKAEKQDPWTPPTEIIETSSGPAKLAEHIGDTIKAWLDDKEELPSKGRAIQPGDVMILVRTRSAFVTQLMRALKTRNIPVSGADRMVLNEQLAVQDLLAIAGFALLPEDDLSLACILKSPLIGWSEDQLYELAIDRKGTLWGALRRTDNVQLIEYLENLIGKAGHERPYEFFNALLQRPCPGDSQSGLRGFRGRLGDDVLDPLNELLNGALKFESDNIPSLQGFLHWQTQGHADVKREMEESGGQVRIMTVHGSKGLQAPIVILPDTTRTSRHVPGQSDKRLLWPHKSGLEVPLWSPRKDMDCDAFREAFTGLQEKSDEEYRRLFYVAMTRAEDRLYIGGYKTGKEILPDCWYNYAKAAMEGMDEAEAQDDGSTRLSNPQTKEPVVKKKLTDISNDETPLPQWVYNQAPEEPDPPAPLMPSRPSEEEPAVSSPLEKAKTYRFRRGNVTHKLLQFLPDLPADKRLAAAGSFVEKHGHDLPEDIRGNIVREVMDILERPDFVDLFQPSSLSEVPITGLLPDGRLISGQIDRLVIGDHKILIIDYKSNRPPPKHEEDVAPIYKNQMQAYYDTLKEIYPDHKIECALLWTDGPVLMPLALT